MGGGGGPRARYGAMENGNVLLHSYELINKKGTYTKGSLSDSFICLSPGMIVSTKVCLVFGSLPLWLPLWPPLWLTLGNRCLATR